MQSFAAFPSLVKPLKRASPTSSINLQSGTDEIRSLIRTDAAEPPGRRRAGLRPPAASPCLHHAGLSGLHLWNAWRGCEAGGLGADSRLTTSHLVTVQASTQEAQAEGFVISEKKSDAITVSTPFTVTSLRGFRASKAPRQ